MTTQELKRLNRVKEEFESYLTVGPLHILEVNSRVGFITPILAHKKFLSLIIDEDEKNIREVNASLNDTQRHYIKAEVGTVSTLSNQTKYDIILTSLSFLENTDRQSFLKSCYELLEDHGRIIIVELLSEPKKSTSHTPCYIKNSFTINELTHDLIQANFSDVYGRKFYSSYQLIGDFKCPYSLFSLSGQKRS